MKDIMIFRRVEKKYRLTPPQKAALLDLISSHLTPDAHGRNTICSLYLDTPDHLIIRNSRIARTYKEKLRLRHIGRLQRGECSIEAGFIWSDLLTDLERVADHCSNIAGCVLEMRYERLDLHGYLDTVRTGSAEYAASYEAYARKYAVE